MKFFFLQTYINSHFTLEASVICCTGKKCLDLNEKVTILEYANEHPEMDCRKLAEHIPVGKTTTSNILKDSKNFRRDYELFQRSYKKRCYGKYHVINKTLYKWYGKCTRENVHHDEPLL